MSRLLRRLRALPTRSLSTSGVRRFNPLDRSIYSKEYLRQPNEQTTYGFYVVYPETDDAPLPETLRASLDENRLQPIESLSFDECLRASKTIATHAADQISEHASKFDAAAGGTENIEGRERRPEPTFDNVVRPISERMGVLWEMRFLLDQMTLAGKSADERAEHLRDVHPNRHPRLQRERVKVALDSAIAEGTLHAGIHRAIREVKSTHLDPWQSRLTSIYCDQGKKNGLQLELPIDKKKYDKAVFEANEYATAYLKNISKVLPKFEHPVSDPEVLVAAPNTIKARLHDERTCDYETINRGPYTVRLVPEHVYPFMKYCRNRGRRQALWETWTSRCSIKNVGATNNSIFIEDIRTWRQAIASSIEYESYAHYALEGTMANNVKTVKEFIESLHESMKPSFIDRWEMASQLATRVDKLRSELRTYDLFYYGQRAPLLLNDVNLVDMQQYFEVDQVFASLLRIAQKWLCLNFVDVTNDQSIERWSPSVRIYRVESELEGSVPGHLFVDLYPEHADKCLWMSVTGRVRDDRRGATPIVYLNGAAFRDRNGKATLHFDELKALCKEFGRALTVLESRSPYPELAAWWYQPPDACNTVPIFFEKLLSEPAFVQQLCTPSVKDNTELTQKQIKALCKATHEQELFETYRRVFLADYDLRLASMVERRDKFWLDLYRELWREYFTIPHEKYDYTMCNFPPIMCTPGLGGRYYAPLWSEMLAYDMLAELRERNGGVFSSDINMHEWQLAFLHMTNNGADWRKAWWEFSGGRDPSVQPMIDQYTHVLPRMDESVERTEAVS